MSLFDRKTQEFEALPDQITTNDLIQCWYSNTDGSLGYLAIDGSAKSAESEERFWRRIGLAIIGSWIAGVGVKNIALGIASLSGASGTFGLCAAITLFCVLTFILSNSREERRVCFVTVDTLTIQLDSGTQTHSLNDVIGVQRHAVDEQKIDKEKRRYRKQRNPKLKQPFSATLMLETSLGQVDLGAVFGLEDARNIADAINSAIQFMKGRTATGAGPVVDPRFQYRNKSAGQIPN